MEKMNIKWNYTNKIVNDLLKINRAREIVDLLEIPVSVEEEIKKEYKILITITSVLIMLSTVFIKQHVIVDVLGAFIIVPMYYIIRKKKINLDNIFYAFYKDDEIYVIENEN